jgi:alkanesulfonate monooxygenase SsuD/methylene tetrahydromethanopterin reductase-like flavin-dependent oxidoreductase (luciferase family)
MLATVADATTGMIAPKRVLAAARRAEAAGFDGVYLGDHLLHPHPILESIVTAGLPAQLPGRARTGRRAVPDRDARPGPRRPPGRRSDSLGGMLAKGPTRLPDRLFAAGRPEEIATQLQRYWRAGCTEFMLAPADQGGGYLDQVELLATEVLPRLRQFS